MPADEIPDVRPYLDAIANTSLELRDHGQWLGARWRRSGSDRRQREGCAGDCPRADAVWAGPRRMRGLRKRYTRGEAKGVAWRAYLCCVPVGPRQAPVGLVDKSPGEQGQPTALRMRPIVSLALAAAFLFGVSSSPALADPCVGALPESGTAFSGIVRYVGDGDGLCLGPANRPDRWIEVRLADFNAPELSEPGGAAAKQRLISLTMGKLLVCRAGRRSYDRVVAACTLQGRPLGALLRQAGGTEGGRGSRR